MAADILIVRISSYEKKYYQYWTHIYGIADMILLIFNCEKTWIFKLTTLKQIQNVQYLYHFSMFRCYSVGGHLEIFHQI